MSDNPDKPTSNGGAPRPGAGDAARTQQIPRVSGSSSTGSDGQTEAPKKRRPGPAAPATSRPAGTPRPVSSAGKSAKSAQGPAAKSDDKPASKSNEKPASKSDDKPVAKSDDKAATTQKSAPAKGAAAKAAPSAAKKTTKAPAATSGSGTSGGRPPTAGDYARTTSSSPSSTAVIPAVKDSGTTYSPGKTSSTSASSTPGRQASLRLVRVDPWSVTRLAFVISVALMIVAVVAVTIFWIVLDLTGVWDQLNGSITNVLSDSEGGFDLTDYLGLGRLVGLTLVLSAINVVLMTALATIAAHLYNLAAQLIGGFHVTFADE